MPLKFGYYGKFLECKMELEECSEPTNIKWENQATEDDIKRKKKVFNYFFIFSMLIASAFIILYLQRYKANYNKLINRCDEMANDQYLGQEDKWKRDAFENIDL